MLKRLNVESSFIDGLRVTDKVEREGGREGMRMGGNEDGREGGWEGRRMGGREGQNSTP